jgi:hypothetical protein
MNSIFSLRLACCARGRVVLYRIRGDPRTRLLRCARPRHCAWLCCARKRVVCVVAGGDPGPFRSLSLSLSLLFAHLPALRDIDEAPRHAPVLKSPPACGASRLRRLEYSRVALLF